MVAKKYSTSKIIDVAEPDKISPDPSGRPVVVTNRPVLANDPMMVEEKAGQAPMPTTAPVVTRQAKTISPISDGITATDPVTDTEPPATPAPSVKSSDEPETSVPELTETSHSYKAVTADAKEATPETGTIPTDEESALKKSAAEARLLGEEEARRQELEALIAAGTYAVPINAVQRKKSRMVILLLCLLAVALAAVLFDVALDSHVISVPGVPHTHFFQG